MADLVEVRVNGKEIAAAIAENRTQQLDRVANALVVATRMAKTIKRRAQRGEFATKPRPYRTGGRYDPRTGQMSPYYISEGYQEKLGAPFRRFQSSAHFHRVVGRRVAGNITGGLWAGLRVRNFGVEGAIIEFTGKSIGMRIKKLKRARPTSVSTWRIVARRPRYSARSRSTLSSHKTKRSNRLALLLHSL